MLDPIRSFFHRSMAPRGDHGAEPTASDLSLAACALLLELAHADDDFSDEERAHIKSAVHRHFDVDSEETERLLELAEAQRRQAVDLWQFTRLIDGGYSLAQKTVLAEIMWGLVYADGELAEREQLLMRKISNLLGLKPGYLAQARKRVEERQGTDEAD